MGFLGAQAGKHVFIVSLGFLGQRFEVDIRRQKQSVSGARRTQRLYERHKQNSLYKQLADKKIFTIDYKGIWGGEVSTAWLSIA